MPNTIREKRNLEKSTIEYLRTNINTDWTGVTTLMSFKDVYTSTIELPIVCIRLGDTTNVRQEVGSNTLRPTYEIVIDLFAKSESQKLDLAHYLVDKLKDGWTYNTYERASGDETQTVGTEAGMVNVISFDTDRSIELTGELDKKDLHRHLITLTVRIGLA